MLIPLKYILFSILAFPMVLYSQIDPTKIEIIRDKWGVPHIYAQTDAEVAYGLAYAHAEDDFGTIQLTLLAGRQKLGRKLGKEGAQVDYIGHLLNLDKVVEDQVSTFSPEFIRVLDGYRDGLNSYAANHPKEVSLKGTFPITTQDLLKAYVLSLAAMSGVADVAGKIASEKVKSLDYSQAGSNAFAFQRKMTTSGEVYLAINSHQPLEGPMSWYEAHLVSEEGWNMMGGLFPGAAMIFHGTNENLGWAHTVNFPDKMDIFQLQMHPTIPKRYLIDSMWHELEERKVKLQVKILNIPINIKKSVFSSSYGPVMKNKSGYYAIGLPVLKEIRAPEQWYKMNKAKNFSDFYKACTMVAIPGFNIVYADRSDTIFYVGNARLPIRDKDYLWHDVVPGNTSKTIYKNYYSFAALPQLINPPAGFLYNTNHTAFRATLPIDTPKINTYDPTMGYKIWDNNRSIRFRQLISQQKQLSWNDFLQIKYDLQLPKDSLYFFIDIQKVFSLDTSGLSERAAKIQDILKKWDRTAELSSIGAAHYTIISQFFYKKYKPESGQLLTINEQELVIGLEYTAKFLMRHFKKLDVRLGEYQFLKRGKKEIPVDGMFDVLAAMYSEPGKKGKAIAKQGESYIMLVRYPQENELPIIETVNCYGASNNPNSPHYDDQMSLFIKKERKEMTLDINKVRREAKRIYSPK